MSTSALFFMAPARLTMGLRFDKHMAEYVSLHYSYNGCCVTGFSPLYRTQILDVTLGSLRSTLENSTVSVLIFAALL